MEMKWPSSYREEIIHRQKSNGLRHTQVYYNSNQKSSQRTLRHCDWCDQMGHLKTNCRRKKGVCWLCGSGSHLVTACSMYIPRRSSKWALCRGNEYTDQGCQSDTSMSIE